MFLHFTKKLFAKLPDKSKTTTNNVVNIGLKSQWLSWHANLITIQRRQCVIAVHDATHYSLFIPCLTKPDFANLQWNFKDAFINSLFKSGFTA